MKVAEVEVDFDVNVIDAGIKDIDDVGVDADVKFVKYGVIVNDELGIYPTSK